MREPGDARGVGTAPLAATDIEEFQLLRVLGRGGMGTVYLARDAILEREVAIKLVRVGTTSEHRLRFLNEARAIARLSHPNVVTIFRAGTTADGVPFLVQELIHGRSLDRVALPLAPRRCLELAIGIARGLAAAHRRGVLHRDIKPSNVMIDQHGTPRLLDFGVAKLLGREGILGGESGDGGELRAGTRGEGSRDGQGVTEAGDAIPATGSPGLAATAERASEGGERGSGIYNERALRHEQFRVFAQSLSESEGLRAAGDPAGLGAGSETEEGEVPGTPRYLAPERWGGAAATARSDLYSFGVMLYELWSGQPPFPQTEREALRRAVMSEEAPPLRASRGFGEARAEGPAEERASGAPDRESGAPDEAGLAEVIMACLARDPDARPGSASELVFRLEQLAAGAPPIPEGNPYRGLAPFEAAQRAVFFGRGAEISTVVDRLRGEPLVVLTGDSGVGKSSLARAGVLPAVVGGALEDGRQWSTVLVTPGRHGGRVIAEALASAATRSPTLHNSDPGSGPDPGATDVGLVGMATRIGQRLRLGASRGVLLLIDQLEELVTSCSPSEAEAAAAQLAALGDGVPGVKVLVTVRGDFFTRVAALPQLGACLTRSLHVVRELAPDEVREAVVGPARAKGVRFESEAMVEEMLAQRAGGLPLLQFALAELWSRREVERAVIPAAALGELGGVAGALAGHADRLLTRLTAVERIAARRLVLALITEEGTRATRRRDELVGAGAGEDAASGAALEALVAGRLVAARDAGDGPPSYQLVHESLISAWGTLRGWLDEAAGQRGALHRLQQAAAQWQRGGRTSELLWSRARLAEVGKLAALQVRAGAGDAAVPGAPQEHRDRERTLARSRDRYRAPGVAPLASPRALDGLGPLERAFVTASQRAARRRLVAGLAIAAAIPAAIASTLLIQIRREQAARDAVVDGHRRAALRLSAEAEQTAAQAVSRRERAWALFDANVTAEAERVWTTRQQLLASARRQLREASSEIERAIVADPARVELRGEMAGLLYRGAQLAEEARDRLGVAELEQRLITYDDGTYLGAWRRPARVSLSAPGATRITVARYRPVAAAEEPPRLTLEPLHDAAGDRFAAELPPGSYLAHVTAPTLAPMAAPAAAPRVAFPFVVQRGAPASFAVALPPAAALPAGFAYVPAGGFLVGSDDEDFFRKTFFYAQPMRPLATGAFLISRHEVTYAEYFEFLRALPPAARAARQPPGLVERVPGSGVFDASFQLAAEPYQARAGELLEYPERKVNARVRWERIPVLLVNFDDALAYAAWLDATGRVPGARVCSELEWERAARGADGRRFPHGDELSPTDANFDRSYGQLSKAFGPDEVGSHPASHSPFGVADMAGNVFEWALGPAGPTTRGGSWYQGASTAVSANRDPTDPKMRNERTGLRVCADPPLTARRDR